MPSRKTLDPKAAALRADGALNPHPERVGDPLFRESAFFDPRDLVQVKYEMLRKVQVEGRTATDAATACGFSRPTFYEARSAFDEGGLPALLPKKRGPRGPHKLGEEVIAFLREQAPAGGPIRAPALAKAVEQRFGLRLHPRTIERALRRQEKKPP